jgi:hypothetical protein
MCRYLKQQGYSTTVYRFSPGTEFPDHSHGVSKKDSIISGRFLFRMGGEEVCSFRTWGLRKAQRTLSFAIHLWISLESIVVKHESSLAMMLSMLDCGHKGIVKSPTSGGFATQNLTLLYLAVLTCHFNVALVVKTARHQGIFRPPWGKLSWIQLTIYHVVTDTEQGIVE